MPAAASSSSSCGPAPWIDDRREAHVLQEGERGGQRVEVVAQHRAADLDHREALGIELRETLEVLVDLLRAGHAGEQAHDGLPGLRGSCLWFMRRTQDSACSVIAAS
jgi:hypothetical protein